MAENEQANGSGQEKAAAQIDTKENLKEFLLNIRDKMADRTAAPIYALTALNHVMTLPNAGDLLADENKEIARDIWLRLKQAGFQLKNPPVLFETEEGAGNRDQA
jgi:hypothetical protein